MRDPIDSGRVLAFLKALAEELKFPTTVYLVGGASAVLEGWRETTIDLDLKFVPDREAFEAIRKLKEQLRVNVELASPDQFLPPLPGWQQRSPLVERIRSVEFRHFDFSSQALSKLERGFSRDVADVREMVRRQLVDPAKLARLARQIIPDLVRYPAVDANSFLRAVDEFLASREV